MTLAATTLADGINLTISIVLILAIVGCGHFLNQIRDILRDMQATQKKLAQRMGVQVK